MTHEIQALIIWWVLACKAAGKNCLIQGPPEHAKTSVLIPLFIHLLSKELSMKTGFVSDDLDLSTEHLTRVRKAILSNVCRDVHPQIRPDHKMSTAGTKGEWSKSKLYLIDQPSPAFEVFPFTGSADGHRLDMIWADDCVTRKALTSEAARKEAASVLFDTYANRLTDRGIMVVTNNCWHREDPIHKMRDSESFATLWLHYTDELDGIHWEAYHPPETWDGPTSGVLPLWDALWPRTRLEAKRQEPGFSWKRLYLGRAITPEDCRFPPREQWGTYEPADLPPGGKVVGFLDPSGGRRADKGDYASMWVLYKHDGLSYVLDAWTMRANTNEQMARVFDAHTKVKRMGFPRGIDKFEVEVLAKDVEWISRLWEAERDRRRDAGLEWQLPFDYRNPVGHKSTRIECMVAPIENKWLLFPADLEEKCKAHPHWRNSVDQVEEWPNSDHDDSPDGLSGAYHIDDGPEASEDAFEGVSLF